MGGSACVPFAVALVAAACMGLGGCSETLLKSAGTGPSSSRDLIDSVMSDAGSGKRASAPGPTASRRSPGPGQAEVYYGSGGDGTKTDNAAKGTPEGATRAAGDGVNLNFENAEIKTVARA